MKKKLKAKALWLSFDGGFYEIWGKKPKWLKAGDEFEDLGLLCLCKSKFESITGIKLSKKQCKRGIFSFKEVKPCKREK